MMKFCPRCNTIISIRQRYCDACEDVFKQEQAERYRIYLRVRQSNGGDKKAYDKYRQKRVDTKEQSFYQSKLWKDKRLAVIHAYKGVDLYALYTTGRIVPATTVHHIIPLKDDFEQRLVDDNLFPTSEKSHQEIHRRYDELKGDQQKLQAFYQELFQMKEKFKQEFTKR